MSSAKPPISLTTAVIAVALVGALGFVLSLIGAPEVVALAITMLIVVGVVAVLAPRWVRRR
ncbi:hypothetical protein ABZ814_30645 [Micromonospora musae]|uniref:hypothetical protein n=1 Tax=Micromonospora musae TaxID=1894970 RepID=UPI0033EECB62